MNDAFIVSSLSDYERQLLMERVYELLSCQAMKYLAGDSTSIPVETAEELLRSLSYTLRLALAEAGKPERELLTADLEELLRQGRHILKSKVAAAQMMWERACLSAPQIPNSYLQDTLKSIQCFFKCYDLWYFSHQIPCAIDYPLCIPVSEELQGVSYLEQWLRRLLIENWLLGRFPQQAVCRLLSKIAADYWQHPLNICEQPLINAVGLAVLGKSPLPLALSDDDCRELERRLFDGDDMDTALTRGIRSAAGELCAPKEVGDYMNAVVRNTLPRLRTARQYGSVEGIFILG